MLFHIENALTLANALAAALVAIPALFFLTRMQPRPSVAPLSKRAENLARVHLRVLWLVFIPLSLVSHLLGDRFQVVFGGPLMGIGFVQILAAAALAGLAIVAFGAVVQARRPISERVGLLAFGAIAVLALGAELDWGQFAFGTAEPNLIGDIARSPTAALAPAFFGLSYAVVGWLVMIGSVFAYFHPKSPVFGSFSAVAQVFSHTRRAATLLISAGLLMQHPAFRGLSEWALAAGGLYLMAGYVARTTPRPATAVQRARRGAGQVA
ncbi:hypothetical protein BH11PSE2_BH11PSE2_10610 [soil metagenome]